MAEIIVPLAVRDLTYDDLPACAWTGSATHMASMAAALDRVERGEVDYIAVCPPSGVPIGPELAVEYTNPRAKVLYERLGYVAYGSKPDWWDKENNAEIFSGRATIASGRCPSELAGRSFSNSHRPSSKGTSHITAPLPASFTRWIGAKRAA